jgi:acyl-CoA reductase-like NAD-dependent aldehyde dehydrogenase
LNISAKPTEIEIHGNFVDGREIEAGRGETLDVRNPATGDVIARIPNSTAEDIDRAMKSARAAFEGRAWGGMEIRSRARLVNRLADAFEANLEQLYRLETLNNGRPVNETRAQLSRLPDFFRYFAGLALARRDAVIPVEGSYLNYTLRTPIGIVANCTPFNHPLMIMCKSLAAVLASGCVTVVKPSEYTPLTTLKLAQIFTEADLPPGVFNVVLGLGQSAGRMLAEHPDINKLVLTGGTEAGRIAGGAAAKVFAHQTMELGGKTPVMVFADYDVDQAVNYAAFGAFIGAGQTCVCASRHIVQASVYDEFVEKLKAKTLAIRIGDPFDPNTQLGPVISARQRDRVLTYSRFGREDGARLVTGGVAARVPGDENGYFVEPTVFADVSPRCASSRKKYSDRSLRSRPSRTSWMPCGSPMIRRSGWRQRSAPVTSAARIASPLLSRPASSGSTIITASTRPRPGAASMTPASGASSARKALTIISIPRA